MKKKYIIFFLTLLGTVTQIVNTADPHAHSAVCPACHRSFPRGSRFPHQGCPGTPSEYDSFTHYAALAQAHDARQAMLPPPPRRTAAVAADAALSQLQDSDDDAAAPQDHPPQKANKVCLRMAHFISQTGAHKLRAQCPFETDGHPCTTVFTASDVALEPAREHIRVLLYDHMPQVHGKIPLPK